MNEMPGRPAVARLDLQAACEALARLWPDSDRIDTLSARLAERPARNTLLILGLGALVFYRAERAENSKVSTFFDALEYCSSSLSVGYTSIYPQTPLGKMVATFLMTYGPALSSAVLDGPRVAGRPDPTQERILGALERILAELQARDSPKAGPSNALVLGGRSRGAPPV